MFVSFAFRSSQTFEYDGRRFNCLPVIEFVSEDLSIIYGIFFLIFYVIYEWSVLLSVYVFIKLA